MKNDSTFFSNSACEYFPCHKGAEDNDFNCLFCFCPLYSMGERCGGSFKILEGGVKDCSDCLKPHRRENYAEIIEKLKRKG